MRIWALLLIVAFGLVACGPKREAMPTIPGKIIDEVEAICYSDGTPRSVTVRLYAMNQEDPWLTGKSWFESQAKRPTIVMLLRDPSDEGVYATLYIDYNQDGFIDKKSPELHATPYGIEAPPAWHSTNVCTYLVDK